MITWKIVHPMEPYTLLQKYIFTFQSFLLFEYLISNNLVQFYFFISLSNQLSEKSEPKKADILVYAKTFANHFFPDTKIFSNNFLLFNGLYSKIVGHAINQICHSLSIYVKFITSLTFKLYVDGKELTSCTALNGVLIIMP